MSDPPPPAANAAAAQPCPPAASSSSLRDYRKGNWTLQETLVLISGKRRDDERRAESRLVGPACSSASSSSSPRPAGELRWKWVENYCWSGGCFRSQNQCNDKWDNLLRDYKKVRDHEARHGSRSYWTMERPERKERNLPTSMPPEVYQALADAIRRRTDLRAAANARGGSLPRPAPALPLLIAHPPPPPPALLALPPPPEPITMDVPTPTPPPPTQDAAEVKSDAPPAPPPVHHSGTCEMLESDEDDQVQAETKRRKIRKVTQSVVDGASILARTLLECEERRDKRHHDLMELQERRLRLESEQTETNRQGLATLVSAVNSLSCAIQAMISDGNRCKEDDDGDGAH